MCEGITVVQLDKHLDIMTCWVVQWLTVQESAQRLCGSHRRHAAIWCSGAGAPAGCSLPSQSPLFSRLVCWPDSGASWWTWQRIRCRCSSLCSVSLLQTARCRQKIRHYLLFLIICHILRSRLFYYNSKFLTVNHRIQLQVKTHVWEEALCQT